MAYDRAPRWIEIEGSTGPNVGPNTYQATYDETCGCKGTNWAPFLSCSRRKYNLPVDTPAPNAYFPKPTDRVVGGASLLYTAPRFPKRVPRRISRTHRRTQQVRLKGFMYHCKVPYTLLGYPPTIPNIGHEGYKSLEDKSLVECCDPNYDRTLGPAFYTVNIDTFGECYRGSYWSRYSGRGGDKPSDVPGVGAYDLIPREKETEDYLNRLRQERRKNATSLRYADQLELHARKNDYPAPNQYAIGKVQCWRIKRKVCPKKLIRPRKFVQTKVPGPAPNQYNDPRTAFESLHKPSCKKGLSAFLTNAQRFPESTLDVKPSPNQYSVPSFVEELKKKVSPYAVRNTSFDSSIPKRPETPEDTTDPCEDYPEPTRPPPPSKPVYPFNSTTRRFTPHVDTYDASCASYDVRQSFAYATLPRSFRKVKRYDFLFSEDRFSVIKNFFAVEDKSYIPGHIYNINKYTPCMGNRKGSFAKALRFPKPDTAIAPGPASYNVETAWKKPNFNVTLMGGEPLSIAQQLRVKTAFGSESLPVTPEEQKKKDKQPKKKEEDECSSAIKSVVVEFSRKRKSIVTK